MQPLPAVLPRVLAALAKKFPLLLQLTADEYNAADPDSVQAVPVGVGVMAFVSTELPFPVGAASGGMQAPGFQTLLRLARHERCWFKLIGPYRISAQVPKFADVTPFARALAAAAPTPTASANLSTLSDMHKREASWPTA